MKSCLSDFSRGGPGRALAGRQRRTCVVGGSRLPQRAATSPWHSCPAPGAGHLLPRTLACLGALGLAAGVLAADPWWQDPLKPDQLSLALRLLLALSVLSLAPALLIMVTSFTRIIVVLALLRSALSTQQTPPNFVLVSLALFLTFFIMYPVLTQINDNALQPYLKHKISYEVAVKAALAPLRDFMLRQTREQDLALFVQLAGLKEPVKPEDLPTQVLLPSFMISELRTAFEMAFVLYLPFVVIDLLVSTLLMSMGMLMLPPVMVSLPLKLLLFVLVDGWHLLAQTLVMSFH
ncbi:MAG: flagellar type III secretion system pore protein FliP [Armatimonadetes bacterium]|nr:flagellar type III secretion system pore protein FliP [Armatimonadota bacterium]